MRSTMLEIVFFRSFDVTCGHLTVNSIMDEVCAALENEVGLVEVDHMLHLEFVNEGEALLGDWFC